MQSERKKTKNIKPTKSGSKKARGRTKLTGKSQDSLREDMRESVRREKRSSSAEMGTSQSRQQTLLESEAKYRILFNQAQDGIGLINSETGGIIDCNLEFESLCGRELKELKKMKIWELRPPGKVDPAKKKFLEIKERGTGGSWELEFQKPNGDIVPVEFASRVIKIHGKQYIQSIVRDITERKKMEEALRESEKRYRTLVETAQEGIGIADADENIIFANQAFADLLGYKKRELLGLNLRKISDKEQFTEFRYQTEKRGQGESSRYEAKVYTKNGEPKYLSVSASPIFNEKATFTGTLGLFVDITERKLAEDAVRNALEESQRRQVEISSLLQSSRTVLESKDFQDTARAIFDSCKSLIGAAAGYVALLSKDGRENELLFLDAGGLPCTVDPSLPMPIRGLREQAYQTGRVVYDNRFSKSEWTKYLPGGHVTLENVLFAPLMIKGRAAGVLGLANKPEGFTQNDARLASAFGELCAVALMNSRTLESLEKSEERFRSVAQTASDAIITVDSLGDIVFWNRVAEVMFGHSSDEALGKPLTFLMPERFHQAHKKGVKQVVSTGETKIIGKTVETTGLRKNQSEFPLELSIAMWKSGEEIFFTGIIRDITARKRAEQALKESEEKFRNLAEQSPNMIFINKKRRVVYANKRCAEIMGYTREECYSPHFNFLSLIAPESQELIKTIFSRHVKGEEVAPFEYTLITRQGKKIEAILTTKLIRYEGDAAMLGTVTDITERKRAEQEIQKLNETLEFKARELAAANKELEAFSYSVSHDLRAPLRSIDGFSRMLLEDYENKLDETGKDSLRRVRAGTQHMRQLIDDLLNLSLVIRTEITREETNLSELVRSIAAELKKTQPERQVQFAIQDQVYARGDPRLLREVLENLLNNAWRFTEKHSQAKIEFAARRKEDQTVYLVRDDGAGFDMTCVDKLFIPFQRLHSAAEFSGNGIGLAIASRIINRHGGRIWAEGKVGKGATFYFTLQRNEGEIK